MKKAEREKFIQHESMKYKASKKTCNLYVKNFPVSATEKDLRDLFEPFGEIESFRIFYPKSE